MIAGIPTALLWKVIGALAIIAAIGTLYGLWQAAETRAELSAIEARHARQEAAAEKKAREAMQQAALERINDNSRIDTAAKGLSDELDAIEAAVAKGTPLARPDAAARAVSCARLRRSGQTGTDLYRDRC